MSVFHQIALTKIKGIGVVTARALATHFGSAEAIFSSSQAELLKVPGMRKNSVAAILNKEGFDHADKEIQFIEKYKIQTFFFQDENFPQRLKNCYDSPVLLYYKGTGDNLNFPKVISVVGTRNATNYGKDLCESFIQSLQKHNVLVVSGLAHGIDSLAHKACVKYQVPTIGVLGHGLDRIYPAANRQLAEQLLENGGLLSEFPSGTNPDRENFPKRNRVIAGLADATVVVEASLKGGALITAEIANSYNRDVFAFPGNVNHEFSAGCNYLIKTNRANLIGGIKDLEYFLGWAKSSEAEKPKQIALQLNLSNEERKIVELVQMHDSIAIDELAIKAALPQSKLVITILGLEMQGVIISLPGKTYRMA